MIDLIINKKNHTHLIYNNYDKIVDLLTKKFPNYKLSEIKFKNIIIKNTLYYYIFDMNQNNKDIIYYIKQLISSNIINDSYYIIIANLLKVKKFFLNYLLSLLDKYNNNNYKIIIISELNNIPNNIKSKCLYIKNKTNKYDKSKFINDVFNYIYNSIYIKYDRDNKCLIKEIKEISMMIISSGIYIKTFSNHIIDYIINKPYIINKDKKKIIDKCAHIDYLYKTSYNKIIYYEYLLLDIYNILYNNIKSYYI